MDRMRVGHLGVLVCAKEFVQRFQGKEAQIGGPAEIVLSKRRFAVTS